MYFKPGTAKDRVEELNALIDDIARHQLCETSQFSSPRDPWARALRDYYEPYITTYRRKK